MSKLFPIVILSGGLATRLGSLTKKLPKSLILINHEPFIAHQLRLLKNQGFKKVVLCVGHFGSLIREYVQDGKRFGLSVIYSHDGEYLLGTAGAIQHALSLLEEYFFVMYGDSYLITDYNKIQQTFCRQNKQALMTVFKNNNQGDRSNIEFRNNEIITYDKKNKTVNMTYIDYGLALFKKTIFSNRENSIFYDLSDLYEKLLAEQQLANYEVYQRFYEIGSINGLNEFKNFITKEVICV